jgi:hypothetical protein
MPVFSRANCNSADDGDGSPSRSSGWLITQSYYAGYLATQRPAAEDVPVRQTDGCLRYLGAPLDRVPFRSGFLSEVVRVELPGGLRAVVKARPFQPRIADRLQVRRRRRAHERSTAILPTGLAQEPADLRDRPCIALS